MENGKLIALEGIDGSGKSIQAQRLARRLKEEGIACYATMEPTARPIGSLIRQVLRGEMQMEPQVFATLFAADRLDHLLNGEDGLAEKVAQGVTVVTDRYYFSSYAYHSVDMPIEQVIQANALSSSILRPALTVFIDVEPGTAMERIKKNRERQELFEKKSRLVQVREKYFEAFAMLKEEEKVAIVDGSGSVDQVAEQIWREVRAVLFGNYLVQ